MATETEETSGQSLGRKILSANIPVDKSALVASVILATATVVGLYVKERVIDETGAFQTAGGIYLLAFFGLVLTCILYFLIHFLYKKVDEISEGASAEGEIKWRLSVLAGASFFSIFKKRGWAIAGILLLMWLPWFIIRFPGNIHDDSISQLGQYYGLITASDRHPYFDTLVFGAFWDIGNAFGSWQMAVCLYTVLQSVATAVSLAAVICYLVREGAPRKVLIFLVAFLGLFPSYPLFAQTMVKDCLNAWIFLLFVLMVVEAFRSKGRLFRRWPMVVAFVAIALLSSLTKKTGAYIVVPTLIMLVVYLKGSRLKAVTVTAVVIAVLACWNFVALPAMGVAKGESREALSVPIQQTARYVYLHYGELSDEDWEILNGVFESPEAMSLNYSPTLADKAKSSWRENAADDARAAWANWMGEKFLCDPLAFLEAPLGTTWKYYYLTSSATDTQDSIIPFDGILLQDYMVASATSDGGEKYLASLSEEEQEVVKAMVALVGSAVRSGDGLSLSKESSFIYLSVAQILTPLFSMALYVFWIPVLLVCYLARTRNRRTLFGFIPLLLVICSLFVGPTAIARYIVPVLYALPLFVGLAFCPPSKREATPQV